MLSLAAGYVEQIGDVLCLSRLLVFFPFFWLGHALDPARLVELLDRRGVKAASLVASSAFVVFCALSPRTVFPWRKLFMGRYAYALVGKQGCSCLARLGTYALSLVTGCEVLELVPRERREPMSTWGRAPSGSTCCTSA